MSLHSITGLMNSGKTLYMTLKLYIAYLYGKTIISNYDLNFPHYKINRDWLEDLATKETTLSNVAFGFDELWIWLDARRNQENVIASYFFLQSSKDDSEIFLTAQNNAQNDKRLRDNLHTISICSRYILQNNKLVKIDEEKRFLDPKYTDLLYIQIKEYKRKQIMYSIELIPTRTFYIKAKYIFTLYDTTQKIWRPK